MSEAYAYSLPPELTIFTKVAATFAIVPFAATVPEAQFQSSYWDRAFDTIFPLAAFKAQISTLEFSRSR